MTLAAIILAGGRARRLGGASKPDLEVDGRTLLDLTLEAAAAASTIVVVGPVDVPPGVMVTREDPPGGGPVAGIAAGLDVVGERSGDVLVLACDMPRIGRAVPELVEAAASAPDGAWLVDGEGREQPLAAVYRIASLRGALADLHPDGASMRQLISDLVMADVPDDGAASRDVDTWDDLDHHRKEQP
ncbi:molybdenum cofactor guanylyltransferase [Demequina capsici]|uniref:NTP transferase domain-containing protein n=1 Tax=Demequina capsici TaxID=3075620 RepID=A0AA96F9Y4_9MICO|nr:NTP transferase domain-containing protein [Demequina sp. OYTSA14]WNM25450.1 NTP transferase domain-containing protein [Demequina sp. OYTSA14]